MVAAKCASSKEGADFTAGECVCGVGYMMVLKIQVGVESDNFSVAGIFTDVFVGYNGECWF
jgi:hypothetical protein